jgi:hypothetical protein
VGDILALGAEALPAEDADPGAEAQPPTATAMITAASD